MKKIFITGGSGYIGNHTVEPLRALGYYVYNYDLAQNPHDDIFNNHRLEEKMAGADVVYHLAAIPHPYKGNEADYRKVNYDAAIAVFKTAARLKVPRFIFASSGCYYGVWGGFGKPNAFPVTEDNPSPSIAEGQTLYGYFKAAFEDYLNTHSKEQAITSVALRLEGLNKAIVVKSGMCHKFFPDVPAQEQSCKLFHFLGNCSPDNYIKLLQGAIEADLPSNYEAFNVDNGTVHPSIDPHDLIKTYWPDVPDNIATPNGSLISIEKANILLGYSPVEPEGFKTIIDGPEDIIIFGASKRGQKAVMQYAKSSKHNIVGIVDNDANKHGYHIQEYKIENPSTIRSAKYHKIVIASMYYDEILNQLVNEFGIDSNRIRRF